MPVVMPLPFQGDDTTIESPGTTPGASAGATVLTPVFMSAVVVSNTALSPGATVSLNGNWSWKRCQISNEMSGAASRMKPTCTLSIYVPRVLPRFVPPKR